MVSEGLCEECFDELLKDYCRDDYSLQDLKKDIEKGSKEEYLSQGEFPDHNNGCKWPRGIDWF